jgi:hypothetical protein
MTSEPLRPWISTAKTRRALEHETGEHRNRSFCTAVTLAASISTSDAVSHGLATGQSRPDQGRHRTDSATRQGPGPGYRLHRVRALSLPSLVPFADGGELRHVQDDGTSVSTQHRVVKDVQACAAPAARSVY